MRFLQVALAVTLLSPVLGATPVRIATDEAMPIVDADEPILTEGRLVNLACPTTEMVVGYVESAPSADLLERLARCEFQSVEFSAVLTSEERAVLDAAIDDRFVLMGPCSTLGECAVRIETLCAANKGGRKAALVLDARSTETGDACAGECGDGTRVTVYCIKVLPKS